MGERLFGLETEYGLSGISPGGGLHDRDETAWRLMREARRSLRHVEGVGSSGIFLQNGARFYVDSGAHPEWCTPEVTTPWDAVRYVKAADLVLAGLARNLAGNGSPPAGGSGFSEVILFKCNVSYGPKATTWGCHESYLHRALPSKLPSQVIPHLVSRIVYTGAGGFNPFSAGLDFTLSPRVWHFEKEVSGDSTDGRGIFHTKDEPLGSEGYHRLHVICGESLCSDIATWLKVGTTALVVAMVEAGLRPGDYVRLRRPLEAMRSFAGDPTCKATVPVFGGRRLTATQIQRHYLDAVKASLRSGIFPQWAGEVIRRWEEVLNELDAGAPDTVSAKLDWAMKLALYRHNADSSAHSWSWIAAFNGRLAKLQQILQPLLRGRAQTGDALAERVLFPVLTCAGFDPAAISAFQKVRQRFYEIDTRFGQLGPKGIFAQLKSKDRGRAERDRLLHDRLPGVDDRSIEQAVLQPPDTTRARARGECIQKMANGDGRYACDWEGLYDTASCKVLDLSDPFRSSGQTWRGFGPTENARLEMHGRLRDLTSSLDEDLLPSMLRRARRLRASRG